MRPPPTTVAEPATVEFDEHVLGHHQPARVRPLHRDRRVMVLVTAQNQRLQEGGIQQCLPHRRGKPFV
jgi:hypothetical protein